MPRSCLGRLLLTLSLPAILLVAFILFFFDVFPLPLGQSAVPETYHFMYGQWPRVGLTSDDDSLPEQLIGGGYGWLEASDRWIRFASDDADFLTLNPCDSEEKEKKSRWFLRHTNSPQDRENLQDYDNLRCGEEFVPLRDQEFLGIPSVPHTCSERWEVYHVPTQFVYARMRCAVW